MEGQEILFYQYFMVLNNVSSKEEDETEFSFIPPFKRIIRIEEKTKKKRNSRHNSSIVWNL